MSIFRLALLFLCIVLVCSLAKPPAASADPREIQIYSAHDGSPVCIFGTISGICVPIAPIISGGTYAAVVDDSVSAQFKGTGTEVIRSAPLYGKTDPACQDWTAGVLTTGLPCGRTIVGFGTPSSIMTGGNITLFGYDAGAGMGPHTNQDETCFGAYCLAVDTNGSENTAIGDHSLQALTKGTNNTALGSGAGNNVVNASFNIAIGIEALGTGTSVDPGDHNIAIGNIALKSVRGNGSWSGTAPRLIYTPSTVGNENQAIGDTAGLNVTTGSYNVLHGAAVGAHITTGSHNVMAGNQTGNGDTPIITGSQNTFLGDAVQATGDYSNAIGLGSGAIVTASNQISIGNSIVTAALIAGKSFPIGPWSDFAPSIESWPGTSATFGSVVARYRNDQATKSVDVHLEVPVMAGSDSFSFVLPVTPENIVDCSGADTSSGISWHASNLTSSGLKAYYRSYSGSTSLISGHTYTLSCRYEAS